MSAANPPETKPSLGLMLNQINFHIYSYVITLSYLVVKSTLVDYQDVKLYPETQTEIDLYSSGRYQGQLSNLPKCNVNPLKLVSITGSINNYPDCWLWRIIVAYNSGFVFFKLSEILKPGKKLNLIYCLQVATLILTYCLDLEKPFYLWRTKIKFENTSVFYSWYVHIGMTIVLGIIGVYMNILTKNYKALVPAFIIIFSCLILYFSSTVFVDGCFDGSYSIFAIIEFIGLGYLFWSYKRFLIFVLGERKEKLG